MASAAAPGGARPGRVPASSLPPGWIVVALFTLNPLWWLLGFGDFAWCLGALPLWVWILERRRLTIPPSTGWYVLALAWTLVTVVRIDRPTRLLAFGFRFAAGLTALGLAIYVYNERRVTRARLVRAVAWLWVAAVAGGYLGLLAPNGRIPVTLASVLLPAGIAENDFVGNLVRPGFAQVQNLFGVAIPRPKTLFSFTNEWGGNVALLTPFFVAAFLGSPRRRERRFGGWMLLAAVPPVVMSVNRGLWLSLVVIAVMVGARDLGRGRTRTAGWLATGTVVLAILLAATPLGQVIGGRLSESDAGARAGIYREAWDGAVASPILGWGGPRPSVNPFSPPVGTHGHIWLLMFSHGFVGLALYVAWAVAAIRRCLAMRDRTSVLLATVPVVGLLQAGFYNLLPTSLPVILTAVGLCLRGPDPESPAAPTPADGSAVTRPTNRPMAGARA